MKDEWVVLVDIFAVTIEFETSLEAGAQVVSAECDCDVDEGCRHERIGEARVRHVFSSENWSWEDECERLGIPDESVEVVESPAQWSTLVDGSNDAETEASNTLCLGSIW